MLHGHVGRPHCDHGDPRPIREEEIKSAAPIRLVSDSYMGQKVENGITEQGRSSQSYEKRIGIFIDKISP